MSATARAARVPAEPAEPTSNAARHQLRRHHRWTAVVILAGYVLLALLLFSSTWQHPFAYSIGSLGDPPQFMWFLRWPGYALRHLHNPLFSNYVDYPQGVNLMWNASVILAGIILAPVAALLSPVLAYNVLETLAVALSAWTAFLLIRHFVPNTGAAAVGALLYGFSPYMLAESLGHPHVSTAIIPPLLLLLADEAVRLQRRRVALVGIALGVLAAAQLLLGEELLAMTTLLGLGALVMAMVASPREVIVTHLPYAIRTLGIAAGVFLVLAAFPLYFQFFGPQRVHGALQPPNTFVSDLLEFIVPTQFQALAPQAAVNLTHRFTGNLSEWGSYLGLPLIVLAVFTAARLWRVSLLVRMAALLGLTLAVVSLGPKIHVAGVVTPVWGVAGGLLLLPLWRRREAWVAALGIVFGWAGFHFIPILKNVEPGRLMLYVTLMAALLLAVFLDSWVFIGHRTALTGERAVPARRRWPAIAAAGLAMVPLLPALPYWSTPAPIPSFFTSAAVDRIPDASVALIAPFSDSGDARPMLWQAASGMRFRMPEGYLFIPGPGGNQLDPPYSQTHDWVRDIAFGKHHELPPTDVMSSIRHDLAGWRVQTVIVGPMPYGSDAVALFTALLGRGPEEVGGVQVWWNVSQAELEASP